MKANKLEAQLLPKALYTSLVSSVPRNPLDVGTYYT
jgi:hypothetical protein